MADAISIQELIDARTDAKTLEEAVNGDAVTTVLSRLGESYPTLANALSQIDGKLDSADAQIKQAITDLFQNGGLPATPFATKALMTASALVDGDYAQVTDDTVNNGLYVKTAGAWVKSGYDPLIEMDSRLPFIYSTNPVIDVADNKYNKNNTSGRFIDSATGKVTANATGIFTAIPVKTGQRVVVNAIASNNVLVISYGNTPSPAIGEVLTPAAVQATSTMLTTIAPEGVSYLLINVKISTILNVVDTLVVNLENPAVGSYRSYPLRDELAQTKLKDTLTEADLNLTHDNPNFNLYRPSTTTTVLDTYLDAQSTPKGVISSATGLKLAQIPVVAGQTYTLYATDFRSDYFVAGTAALSVADGATTTSYISAPVTDNEMTFTVPEGHAWLFINLAVPNAGFDITSSLFVNEGTTSTRNIRHSISALLGYEFKDIDAHARIDTILGVTPETVAPNSVLKDKTWVAIGDSITEKNFRASKNYHDFVSEDVGSMTVYNYGISGTGFFSRFDVATKVTQKDADYVTIALGTNDWSHGNKELGDFLDVGTTTINGCINTTLTDVLTQFPKAKVAVITPLPRLNNWGTNGANNAYNYNLEILTNLLIKYCSHYSIPCLDLYHNSNLPVWIPAANTYYFTAPDYPSPDGLHPNDAGQRVMADKIRPFLESI